jgi:hypothetical protein
MLLRGNGWRKTRRLPSFSRAYARANDEQLSILTSARA